VTRRSFDEHSVLLSAFSECVASLTDADWGHIRARCKPIAGVSPAALFARAQLATKPHLAYLLRPPEFSVPGAISGVTLGVITSINLAKELTFAVAPSLNEPSRPRDVSTGKAVVDRYIDAMHRIAGAVHRVVPYHAGVATAVDAAAQAVLRRDWLADAQFHEIYRWIEPEIPIARFDPTSNI